MAVSMSLLRGTPAEAFLAAILKEPLESLHRVGLLDWLMERGADYIGSRAVSVLLALMRFEEPIVLSNDTSISTCARAVPARVLSAAQAAVREGLFSDGRRTWLDGRSTVERGFVSAVELTTPVFAGYSCPHCNGGRRVEAAGVTCGHCDGGTVPGIAKLLFEAAPVVSVTLSDRYPQGVLPTWWRGRALPADVREFFMWDAADSFTVEPYSWQLPVELTFHPAFRGMPVVFDTAEVALGELSARCVRLGRLEAGLDSDNSREIKTCPRPRRR